MPDFAMWGPAQTGGFQGIQNLQQTQLSQLAIQETAQDIGIRKQDADNKQKQAALKQQQDQFKMQQQMGIQQLAMKNAGASLPELAQLAMKAGYIDAGEKLAEASAKMNLQLAQTDVAKAKAAMTKLQMEGKVVDDFLRHAPQINSQEDYDMYVRLAGKSGQQIPDSVKEFKWSPDAWQQMQDTGMSRKDQINTQLNTIKTQAELDLKEKQGRLDDVKVDTERARQDQLKSSAEKNRKAGGEKNVPKDIEGMVLNMVKMDYPSLTSDNPNAKGKYTNTQAEYVAQSVGREAVELAAQNPGMTLKQAAIKAYADAKNRGEFGEKTQQYSTYIGNLRIPYTETQEKEFKVNPMAGPAVGQVVKGYKFKGGDPSDKNSWEKQQ